MGHLINPISFRLGVTSYWRSNYIHYFFKSNEYNYYYFIDKLLVDFLIWLMKINWYSCSIFFPYIKYSSSSFFFNLKTKKINNKSFIYFFFNNFEIDKSSNDVENSSRFLDYLYFSFKEPTLESYVKYFSDTYSINFLVRTFFLNKKKELKKEFWFQKRNIFSEISHFNIYYSGFYNIKVYFYLQNRDYILLSLKERANDFFFLNLI